MPELVNGGLRKMAGCRGAAGKRVKHTRQYDSEPGGPCQAERIRDSQRMAIDKGLELWWAGNVMIHVNYDKHITAIYDWKGNLLQEVK